MRLNHQLWIYNHIDDKRLFGENWRVRQDFLKPLVEIIWLHSTFDCMLCISACLRCLSIYDALPWMVLDLLNGADLLNVFYAFPVFSSRMVGRRMYADWFSQIVAF